MLVYMVATGLLGSGNSKEKISKRRSRACRRVCIYKSDVGRYPTTDQGLQALVAKPSDASAGAGPVSEERQSRGR